MKPTDQAELSGSLNRLSEKLAITRQILQDLEPPHAPDVLGAVRADPPPANDDAPDQGPPGNT